MTITLPAGALTLAVRTALDITTWPPCAAKQMRAAAWTEMPT